MLVDIRNTTVQDVNRLSGGLNHWTQNVTGPNAPQPVQINVGPNLEMIFVRQGGAHIVINGNQIDLFPSDMVFYRNEVIIFWVDPNSVYYTLPWPLMKMFH